MKKISLILAVCMLMLALSACTQPAPTTPAQPAAAQDNSLQLVKDKGKLIIGLDDTFAPMGFRDEANNLIGFDIDLATEVCAVLGVEAVFQPIDWNAKDMELNGNKIDCIWNGMSITAERQESMSLTRGYLDNRISIMSNKDITITSKEELANYNIGTQAESSALEVITNDGIYDSIKDKLSEYRSYDEVIMDMQAGRIDVMIVDEVLGQYKQTVMGDIFNVSDVHFGEDLYAVGFRKNDAALTQAVEDAINQVIKSGKAAEISEKWFGKDIVIPPSEG